MKISDILIILFIILLVSLSFYYSNINLDFCNKKISCINNIIKETNNFSLCEETESRDKCYYINSYNYNKDFCKLINNISIKSSCYKYLSKHNFTYCSFVDNSRDCFIYRAIDNKDINICNFVNEKDYCIYSLAYNLKNKDLCNLAGKYKNICLEKFS